MTGEEKRPAHLVRLDKLKSLWRIQVMRDFRLTYMQRIVGWWLANDFTLDITAEHFRTSGEVVVFSGQDGLKKKVGCCDGEVSRAIGQLRNCKHLKRVRRGLHTKTMGHPVNEYLIVFGATAKRRAQMTAVA